MDVIFLMTSGGDIVYGVWKICGDWSVWTSGMDEGGGVDCHSWSKKRRKM